jgi:uncharacterized integral membrane protein
MGERRKLSKQKLRSRATPGRVAYWLVVFAVALILVIALIYVLENRDVSSLSGG